MTQTYKKFLIWKIGGLVASYFLVLLTMSSINCCALYFFESQIVNTSNEHCVYWAPISNAETKTCTFMPAQKRFLESLPLSALVGTAACQNECMVLKPSEVGVRGRGGLPKLLRDVEGRWSPDNKPIQTPDCNLSNRLVSSLFEKHYEDPLDNIMSYFVLARFSDRILTFQPIQREKYLREKLGFDELVNKSNSADKDREILIRHFGNTYGDFLKMMPCRVIRWFNGWVQILALGVFWYTIISILEKYHRFRLEQQAANRWIPFRYDGKNNRDVPLVQNDWEMERIQLRDTACVDEPAVNAMLLSVYETYRGTPLGPDGSRNRAASATALHQTTCRLVKEVEGRTTDLVYLGWSLPSIGFVGTVLGLGTALLSASDLVTPNTELQRDAIQTVTIYLGRAFDKTFVALMLSLVQMGLVYWTRHVCEAQVLRFQAKIESELIPRLSQ